MKSEGSYLIGYRLHWQGLPKPENERVSYSFSLDLQNVTNHKTSFHNNMTTEVWESEIPTN
jgi:hypothetical protein